MGAPYTPVATSNYNLNPPPDDGSTSPSNQITWANTKTKIGDPLKTALEANETAVQSGFGKIIGGAGITSAAVNYTVLAGDQGKMIKATVAAVVITTPDCTVVGSPFWFMVKNASAAAITLAGNNPGVQQNVDGAASISIPAGAGCLVGTDGTNWFTDGVVSNPLPVPQGYLTPVSGTPVITSDSIAATAIFYTPKEGSWTVIHNGSALIPYNFSEMQLTLTSSQAANNIYDIYLAYNGGSPVIGSSPSWAAGTSGSVTPGSCARGTGSGGTALQRVSGVWTNAASMSLIWNTGSGNTTITVPANQGVYLGSIYIDATAGQVTSHRSWGQNRKDGISNANNRVTKYLQAGDSTASWTYNVATIRASNAVPASYTGTEFNVGSGTSCNGLTTFSGLPEEECSVEFNQTINFGAGITNQTGIGLNSTTAFATNSRVAAIGGTVNAIASSSYKLAPSLGINIFASLEVGVAGLPTMLGSVNNMALTAQWRG